MNISDSHQPDTELDDTEDTEGHIYIPKDERDGGVPGSPQKRRFLGEAEDGKRR